MDEKHGNSKRQDCLSWEDYFMGIAFLAAKRSKDPLTQVGACIVNEDNRIVGVGYNGFPKGCSDDVFPWEKDKHNPLLSKHSYVVHAEVNAILNKNTSDLKGCKLYVALFPCNECAKVIIQSGISEVIYMTEKETKKNNSEASRKMFDAANVKISKFESELDEIVINFKNISAGSKTPSPNKRKRVETEAKDS